MGADPEPHNYIVNLLAQSSPTYTDPDRVNRYTLADEFELYTGMGRIFPPQLVVLASKALDSNWKSSKARDEVFGELGFHRSSNPICFVLPV